MKIEYRTGDLFSTDIWTIVHGCNAQGVMRSGVAKTVYEQYHPAYVEYREQYLKENKLQLGSTISVEANGKLIVNAITQEFYGRDGKRYVSYDAVAEAMHNINRSWRNNSAETHIAMPQIGAGLGGGDWDVIAAIIESELQDIHPVVYVL